MRYLCELGGKELIMLVDKVMCLHEYLNSNIICDLVIFMIGLSWLHIYIYIYIDIHNYSVQPF